MLTRTTFLDRRRHKASRSLVPRKAVQPMRKSAIGLVVAGVAASLVLSACASSKKKTNTSAPPGGNTSAPSAPSSPSSSSSGGALDGKGAKVGIILPDTKSSQRWAGADRIALTAACKRDNLNCNIQNAQGNPTTMKTIAE